MPHAICTARVPARLAGEPRLRPGLERWLAEADPAHHGLPAEAIVLVRRLAMGWSALQAGDSATRYAPLATLLAGARRAASAGGDADAVWFADEAELLACLARDALAGLLERRWWWKAFAQQLRGGPRAAAASPSQLALQRWLQAPQLMPRALQNLGPARAQAWLASVGTDGLSRAVAALAQAYVLTDDVEAWVIEGVEPPGMDGPHPSPAPRTKTASTPTAAARRLLRLCDALRSDATAIANVAALSQLALQFRRESPAAAEAAVDSAPRAEHRPTRPHDNATTSGLATSKPARAATGHVPPMPSSPQPRGTSKTATRQIHGDLGMPPTPARAPVSSDVDTHPPVAQATALAEPAPQAAPLDIGIALPRRLDTRHGGLLFLLNAALALGWYGDFTQPRHRGLACPPWRLLLLAGQAWAGPVWRHDPLRRRLIERSAGSREPVPLALWPQLHARVAEALGDDIPARTQLRRMLALPARLQDQGERLDVFYPLARLPLAVRLAGLDRDPGWIPAAGCDIRFHFD
jgi:hypothetical protein